MSATTISTKHYCKWTCTGEIESVVKKYCKRGSIYVVLGINTNEGTVYFYIFEDFLIKKFAEMTIGTTVTLSGVISPENQSHKQNVYTPYFLNPVSVEVERDK